MGYLGKDLTGVKVGLLSVIKRAGYKTHGHIMWIVRCECGKELVLAAGHVARTATKNRKIPRSCGCYRRRFAAWDYKGVEELSLSKFNTYKNSARKRNLRFDVTITYLWELYLKQNKLCALSGVPILLSRKGLSKGVNTASLDRIDNSRGYVVGNVQWVHLKVNDLKGSDTEEEFVTWCAKIAYTQRRKYTLDTTGYTPRAKQIFKQLPAVTN